MRDSDMIIHKLYGGQDITVIPISDVHLGSEECMEDRFERFVQSVAETPNVYVTLGGDLIDNGTKNSVTNVYRAVYPPHVQKRRMAELLKPIKDRILCAVSGNHERRSSSGKGGVDDDPTYDILCKLDIEDIYRENLAIVKIQLGRETRANSELRPTYIMAVAHGAGGGYLPGASVNRGQRYGYIFNGIDVLVLGHTHVPYNIKYKKIKVDPHNNKITEENFKVICATSWLEYDGYPIQKMLYPAAFAEQTMILSGKGKGITITMR